MRALAVLLTFVAGGAVAATGFWLGKETGGDGPAMPMTEGELTKQLTAMSARVEDLEARVDLIARSNAVAAVRDDVRASEVRAAGATPAAASSDPGAPAGGNANANGSNRFAGFEEMRKLRDAPDDATRLALARQMLKEDNPMAVMSALRVLADLAPKEAMALVDQMVAKAGDPNDPNSWQVDRAIATLTDGKGATGLGTDLDAKLREWYSRGDADLKRTTARSLESRGDAGPMQQLVASYRSDLGSADMGKRTRAVDNLGRTRSKEAVPSLVPMLADDSPEVRLGALDALRRTGTDAAIASVQPLLNDPVAAVRDRATRTIESLRRGEREPDFRGGDFRGFDFRGGFSPEGGRRGSN
jgi:HEAT repeat protein